MNDQTLKITKVESGWYTYEVRVKGIVTVGHGNREYVRDAVNRALDRAGGVR